METRENSDILCPKKKNAKGTHERKMFIEKNSYFESKWLNKWANQNVHNNSVPF